MPIFDNELQSQTVVSFVFLQPPTLKDIEAAGVVASWLGLLSGTRPVRFAVFVGQIPPGNAVLFSNQRSALPRDLKLPAGNGSLIALRDHPSDPFGSLLVLAGDDDHQLLNAAQTLALAEKAAPPPVLGVAWSGDTAQLPDTTLPSPRAIDDAPRWLSAAKATPLTNCIRRMPCIPMAQAPFPSTSISLPTCILAKSNSSTSISFIATTLTNWPPDRPCAWFSTVYLSMKFPSSPDRSIVMIMLRQSSSADAFAGAFLDQPESGGMTGYVSLFQNSRFESYALDKGTYQMGNVTWYAILRMWITRYFLLLLLAMTALIFLAAYWAYGWMAWRAHQRIKLAEPEDSED
jgi:hypothetical protein